MNFESKLDIILGNLERLEALPSTVDIVLQKQFKLDIKVDNCLKKQDEIAKLLGEHKILLQRNFSNLSVGFGRFPIKSDEDLKTMDDELAAENRENLVTSMRRLLCDDLAKNLERVFDSDLLSQYNYDGTKGKKALKTYSNFIVALKDCTNFDTFEKFLVDFRSAVKKIKNRDAKRHYRGKDD